MPKRNKQFNRDRRYYFVYHTFNVCLTLTSNYDTSRNGVKYQVKNIFSMFINAKKAQGLLLLVAIFTISLIAPPGIVSAQSADVTVEGRVVIRPLGSSNLPLEPVPNVKVEIWDAEIITYPVTGEGHLPWPDDKLKTVWTNDDGEFSVDIDNEDGSSIFGYEGGRDIYLKIYASNSHFDVRNNPVWIPFNGIYMHETGVHRNVQSQQTLDFGDIQPSGDTQVAFEIVANLEKAHEFVLDKTGIHLAKTNIFYKDLFTVQESYCFPEALGDVKDMLAPDEIPEWVWLIFALSPITITSNLIDDLAGVHMRDYGVDPRFWEAVHHEYGHYVMDQIGDMYPPFTELLHYSDVRYDPEHAFQEGWAHFFSSAVREEYGYLAALEFGQQHIETGTLHYPDVEGAIAQVLWDFYDDKTEEGDDVQLSFTEIVAIISNYDPNMFLGWPLSADHPWNIYDFFEGYRTTHAYDPGVASAWKMLWGREIFIEDLEPPQNPASYTSSHNGFYNKPGPIAVHYEKGLDAISGVKGYYRYWDNNPYTELTPDGTYPFYTSTHAIKASATDGTWYLHILTVDNNDNPAYTTYHTGPFRVGEEDSILFSGTVLGKYNEIFTNQDTQVTIYPEKLSGPGGKLYYGSGYKFGGEMLPYSTPFQLDEIDGLHELKIFGLVEGEDADELTNIPVILDSTAPKITIEVSDPIYVVNPTYITRDSWISIDVMEEGVGVESITYRIQSSSYDSGLVSYEYPFQLTGLPDDTYTLTVESTDYLGNTGSKSLELILDNTPPEQELLTGVPEITGVISTVQATTTFTLTVNDIGSGVETSLYRVTSQSFDTGYTPYIESFCLPSVDGLYLIEYTSTDNLGNNVIESVEVLNDNTGPVLNIVTPAPGSVLQNTVNLEVMATDPTGVAWVRLSIRSQDDPDTTIGYDDISLDYDPISETWKHELDTSALQDGYYIFRYESADLLEDINTIQVDYSIRIWALCELLPCSSEYRAGRTIPVKFSLNMNPTVDPLEPFVHNEELVFEITNNGDLLQTSVYGIESGDYRIDPGILYITNFRTLKSPAVYQVDIYNNGLLIGSFNFQTTRK